MNNRFINTKEDSLSIYLKDVRKSDTITAEKEIELAKRIQEGDEFALNELVNANLRFVIKVAKDYQYQGDGGKSAQASTEPGTGTRKHKAPGAFVDDA